MVEDNITMYLKTVIADGTETTDVVLKVTLPDRVAELIRRNAVIEFASAEFDERQTVTLTVTVVHSV